MTNRFCVGDRIVGSGHPCLIIAEVGQAHDGSLGTAHAYIDAVARTGADAVKFQTHIASAESTPEERFRVKFSPQDRTRYDYWKRMEFSAEQWQGLADHARDLGLIFLSSPFSEEAVDLLQRVGMPAWKIGAGEVGSLPLLEKIASFGDPVIVSTGMSSWNEIDATVSLFRERDISLAMMQCTSHYPCAAESIGLNIIEELRHRYGVPAGLSDHSGTIFAGLAAVAREAKLLEVHVTLSRESFGPDVTSSLTTTELTTLVQGTRFIEAALDNPVDKDVLAAEMQELRVLFGKSIVAAKDIEAGSSLTMEFVAFKKPGTGIPAAQWPEVKGRTVQRTIRQGELVDPDDLA